MIPIPKDDMAPKDRMDAIGRGEEIATLITLNVIDAIMDLGIMPGKVRLEIEII